MSADPLPPRTREQAEADRAASFVHRAQAVMAQQPLVIDRAALHAFVDEQCDVIEQTPVPPDVLDGLMPDEQLADLSPARLWLVAGTATLIGLAVYEDAERFIIVNPQTVPPRRDTPDESGV